MSGHHARAPRFQKIGNDGFGKRLSFVGIGAAAQFIDEHQAVSVGFADNFHDIGDVRRKGGKIFLNALRIAHVAVNFFEYGDFRAFCGNEKATHRHQAEQPYHFQRHRLAARIRTADQQKPVIFAERKADGHHFFSVDQRVPALIEGNDSPVVDFGAYAGELITILRPGITAVELFQHFDVSQ